MADPDRLNELEATVAFQEREIAKLKEALLEQQKRLERLSALCEALVRKALQPPADDLPHEKPPHYR